MSDSVDRVFVHALNTVKRIPRTGSARPPPSDRLRLYGLYKQSTEGDVEGLSPRPAGNDANAIAEREKWDAWHAHHTLSRTEAKRQYITTLISTMHQYATTTPEARELVAELEFVWDQIKSNTGSSSSSSPGAHVARQIGSTSYASLGASAGRGKVGERLKMLRPISDRDEDEEGEEQEEDFDEKEKLDGEEFDLARQALFDSDDDQAISSRDLDVRNRKWRRRIERALVKMTTEVAALREQVEAQRLTDGKRRSSVWAWLWWLIWIAIRQFVVDLTLLGFLVVWARRRGDQKVEHGLALLFQYVRDGLRNLRLPEVLKR